MTCHVGHVLDVLPTLPEASVDAVVTDPPYGLEFMGVAWDTFSDRVKGRPREYNTWGDFGSREPARHPSEQARIAAKKGRAFEAFSYEWAAAIQRVMKPGAHLLAFGGSRTYHRLTCAIEDAGFEIRDCIMWLYGSGFPKSKNIGNGFGTALKPAHEPIVLARKPLAGTVAANVQEHGTGALNIDGCRVGDGHANGVGRDGEVSAARRYTTEGGTNFAATPGPRGGSPSGRWPANVIHDGSDEVLEGFPEQAGAAAPVRGDEASMASTGRVTGARARVPGAFHGDTGGAARFFYCAKASRSDRTEAGQVENRHPTVKPTDLMRYLCRLVTPPGGVILDPFMGSGSTGKAAILEGLEFIGIDRDPESVAVAERRLALAREEAERRRAEVAQLGLAL